MARRKFPTMPLSALAATGALLAAGAGSAQAVTAPSAVPSITLPADTLKGFGHGGKDALALTQIKSLKLDWYYTWQARYYATTSPAFVPMIKDAKRLLERDALGWVARQQAETKTKHLLGFNEPDHKSQANMSVDEAIRLWPKLMATWLRLGSPAPADTNNQWLKSFMAKTKAKGLRVDFVTMHG